MARLAGGPISGSPEIPQPMTRTGGASRRSAAAFSLRRRAALFGTDGPFGSAAVLPFGPARPPQPSEAGSASVSPLLAGGYRPRAEPRRRPCAGCEPNTRAPHRSKARISRAPDRRIEDLFSGPASGLLRHHDAS